MALNSLSFFLFLPVVYLVFYLVGDGMRWAVLLASSYLFYASWQAPHLLVLLWLVTLVSFSCGRMMGRSADEPRRRRLFWTGASGCLAALTAAKYLPHLFGAGRGGHPLLISIGVSYFTFQAISYLCDVYLKQQEPEQHLGYHALALAFFPKLLQGPIERAGTLLPQLKRPYRFDYDSLRSALLLFMLGLFKKCVVADRLAFFADAVYGDVHSYAGLPLATATYAYALQIYFEFSGYTDMARGAAALFGVDLSENFNSPYLATSLSDFWRRWHISFSRWILDYIFTPLHMAWRYHGARGTALALLVTFLLSGLWHGGTWGYLAWGGLHGCFLAASTLYRPWQKKLQKRLGLVNKPWYRAWQVAVTFHLVCLAWVFFRASTVSDALYLLSHLKFPVAKLADGAYLYHSLLLGQSPRELAVLLLMLASIAAARFAPITIPSLLRQLSRWSRWAIYYLFLLVTALFAVYGNGSFIYYKF